MSLIALLILGVSAVLWLRDRVDKRERRDARALILHTRAIASFHTSDEELCLADRLQLRALPNQRLVRVFEIDNSFTTTDEQHHKQFLARATRAIQGPERGAWTWLSAFDIAGKAIGRVHAHLKPECPAGMVQIPLARLVRTVTFIVILSILLDVDSSGIAIEDAVEATEAINRLWMFSKDSSEGREVLAEDQQRLRTALRNMLPNQADTGEPRDNPINIIMPAYETMWRVVLLTFVSAASRASDMETVHHFQLVLEHVPQCFGVGDEESRAVAFAKEGLRLYPPTKRIYRGSEERSWQADVERCHHDPGIWGHDALKFRPSRFMLSLTEDQRRAYMPFSIPPHACPAARGFGERMIILLVVALTRHLGIRETGLRIKFRDAKLDTDLDSVLPNNRDGAENWTVVDNDPCRSM